MGLFNRFFGRKEDRADQGPLVANPAIEDPLCLELLFQQMPTLDAAGVVRALSAYHPSMGKARCEMAAELTDKGQLFGLVGWGTHVIRLVGFDTPMPAKPTEYCVRGAHYSAELKTRARQHGAHLLLYYGGYETSPLEQYLALAAVCGALASFGAVVVCNESAMMSLPAELLAEMAGQEAIDVLREMLLLHLFCGFLKYTQKDRPGVWMRTHGAHRLGLPDLAVHASRHDQGEMYFDAFETIFRYLLDSGAVLDAGHTLQIAEEMFFRFRRPREDEAFLASPGAILVVEPIGPDEVNQ